MNVRESTDKNMNVQRSKDVKSQMAIQVKTERHS